MCFIRSNSYKLLNTTQAFLSIISIVKTSVTITFYRKMNNMYGEVKIWSPCKNLTTKFKRENYGVVILNTPISFDFGQEFVLRLWDQAKVRLTVDGGTKRWLQWLTEHKCNLKSVPFPDLITGDMDSLSKDVLNQFRNSSTKIVVTPDQDETDYVKALRELKKYCTKRTIEIETVYVLADTCGRFDQIMANINALYKSKSILNDIKIFQIASSSITWLLDEGLHEINIPASLRNNQEWCALIPVGLPCTVRTTGLKWNLDNKKIAFGGLVSTSNTYDGSPIVTVKTDAPVIWSMGINTLDSISEIS